MSGTHLTEFIRFRGGNGNDTLDGAGSIAPIAAFGEAGSDRLAGGDLQDTLDGGSGVDTADFSAKTAAVELGLRAAETSVLIGGILEDRLRNIENVIGGSAADKF
jgi:Ca2+-binding RTX toxin-like protein